MDFSVKVIGKTPNNKEIGYRAVDGSVLYEAAFKDGGEVPNPLKGKYSNILALKGDVLAYLASFGSSKKPARNVKKNA